MATTKVPTATIQNPLWDCDPPGTTSIGVDRSLDILRQATEVKQTLERIEKEDPHARSHHFPYRLYPENIVVLNKKGFQLTWEDPYTKVSWSTMSRPSPLQAPGLKVDVV
jgi:hypothetical protein